MLGFENPLAQFFPDRWFFNLLVWGNILLAIACAINEVMRSRTSQGSVGWLLSLALLPFPTTLLYMVFGLKVFDDYASLQTRSRKTLRQGRKRQLDAIDHHISGRWPVLGQVADLPFLEGNSARLLIDGPATFDAIFEGIERAQRFIFAQFYIIRDDDIGRVFADRLIAKAKSGVVVYLLYDEVGSWGLPRSYKRALRDAGVHVAGFNQRHRFLRVYGPTRLQYRTHRKIVVIDGGEAYVGGHNVGDEYLGRDKHFGHWRDTHVHLVGPAAAACSLTFREDWEWATGQSVEGGLVDTVDGGGDQTVLVMPTGPADKLEDCSIAFSEVISKAQRRLWIVSPYFVPDTDMQVALYGAAMRGADVRVMLPEKPDHRIVWLASNAHADSMIDHGVQIYRYRGGFLHQKVILVDDEIAGVGTVNFDNRSFRINFEVTMWFTGKQMIDDVTDMLEADFASSIRQTSEERRGRPWYLRFLGQAARLFSPIL